MICIYIKRSIIKIYNLTSIYYKKIYKFRNIVNKALSKIYIILCFWLITHYKLYITNPIKYKYKFSSQS